MKEKTKCVKMEFADC
uniref:Uncharacterized protein n=1 Tax=Anguilla anguilla TaxID=7936 RepID=A0A0E9V5B6_ANGAN